ncbi:conserved protein of unknown function [Rhodovastum atsumiense]|uniref:Uncharacterized protein n=1 Tax=Rhodovastum atsumiense TaxID=504468 RepID=A0A5M6IWV0_9PROT|nr:hypothetical protein [Rhodovastum atsumiense]KAA5612772.1 hypothetical protein F1189_08535 [Rhodovastum atsumiense]CAH2602663.1 conserved protein of unknown function [Rhodovastum atsumiense]
MHLPSLAHLSPAERNRLTVIVILLLVGLFVPLFYLRSSEDLRFAENMVQRRLDRMQRRGQDLKPPTENLQPLDRKVTELQRRLDESRRALSEQKRNFAATGAEAQQSMRVEISDLADAVGLIVETLTIGPADSALLNGRAVASLHGHGPFHAVQNLLRGMKDLSYRVAVIRFAMEAAPAAGAGQAAAADDGTVRITLQLVL